MGEFAFLKMKASHGRRRLIIFAFALFHAGAIGALWFFSWPALAVSIGLYVITALGIAVGYHRLLTHESFKTFAPVRWLLAFAGSLAGQGDPLNWVAIHRKHHQSSDTDEDPHSPVHGFIWSHADWLMVAVPSSVRAAMHERYVPDLLKERMMLAISRCTLLSQIMLGFALCIAGWLIGGWWLAVSLVLWGIFLRVVVVWHITWMVNSVTHRWGYRNYPTKDHSTNHCAVALLSFGEGWHNNHHAHPTAANHGHRWWEVDWSYRCICLLKMAGLAWDVKYV